KPWLCGRDPGLHQPEYQGHVGISFPSTESRGQGDDGEDRVQVVGECRRQFELKAILQEIPEHLRVHEVGEQYQSNFMIKVQRLGYVLLSIAIATVSAYSQQMAGEYVAPSQAVPRGSAPRMQVQ